MEQKNAQPFFWEKVKAGLLLGILIVLILFAVVAGGALRTLRQYDMQVQNIITRLDRLTAQLDQLDTEGLVQTVNAVSEALGDEEVTEMLATLRELSGELNELDLAELGGDLKDLVAQAQESIAGAEETLAKAAETIDGIDIKALNAAISDLQTVIEPLAKFVGRFG